MEMIRHWIILVKGKVFQNTLKVFLPNRQNKSLSSHPVWPIIYLSMWVTVVGDETCWRQLEAVGDGFGRFRQQHPLSFTISVTHRYSKKCHQHPKVVTNIKSAISNFHQHLCSRNHIGNVIINLVSNLTLTLAIR